MSPVPLPKFQMAPVFRFLISSRFKKEEPRYVCLSEDKSSHSSKIGLRFLPQYRNSYRWGYYSAPLYMSSQVVMSSKQTNNSPGLCPTKGHEACTCIMNLKYTCINVIYLEYDAETTWHLTSLQVISAAPFPLLLGHKSTHINWISKTYWRRFPFGLYRVIKNDFRGFNNLSYTIHLR
jgi:hypothetical protein